MNFISISLRSVLLLVCIQTAAASADSGITQIHAAVNQFLTGFYPLSDSSSGQRVEIEIGYIDPRLSLPVCETGLETSLNSNKSPIGKVSVKVQCYGNSPWSKYVPAQIHVFERVIVSSQNLVRGHILELSDLDYEEVDLATIRRTPVFDYSQAIGKELRNSLSTGIPLNLESLRSPKVIKRGDQVQILAETATVVIRQQGEALQDGEIGKLINVRNNSSRLVVQARVVASGKTVVPL